MLALIGAIFINLSVGIPLTIKVFSIPSGASVFIRGTNTTEITPCVIDLEINSSGSLTLELRKEGYENYTQEIRGPQDTPVQVRLNPIRK